MMGPSELRAERDLDWMKRALGDTERLIDDRAMLLEAVMRLPADVEQWRDHVMGLKSLVADQPSLISRIDEWLKPRKLDKAGEHWDEKRAKRQEQQEAERREDQRLAGFSSGVMSLRILMARFPPNAAKPQHGISGR